MENEMVTRAVIMVLAKVLQSSGCPVPSRAAILSAVNMGVDGSHVWN